MEVQLSVPESLLLMQDAVKRGALDAAALQGSRCLTPLSLTPSQITFGPLLSTGAESRVFKGVYQSLPVAIKQPIVRTAADLERFRKELKMLAALEHPCVVSLLAARALPPNYYLVMPLEGRSFYDVIHKEHDRLNWRQVMEVACQITSAMQCVHERGILHRDLKTRNVLQGNDGCVKIIDFGIADGFDQDTHAHGMPSGGFYKRRVVGTLEYMAPEVLQGKGHSRASDVYAFGVTLNEIATGIYPFSDCNKDNPDAHTVLEMGYGRQELATAVVAEGLRPTLPSDCPAAFSELMLKCWSLNPAARPSFDQLYQQFSRILSHFDGFQITVPVPIKDAVDVIPVPSVAVDVLDVNCETDCTERASWMMDSSEDSYSVHLTCGAFASAGFRGEDRMEDRHIIAAPFQSMPSSAVLGVFDGHRGSETAQFAVDHLQDVLHRQALGSTCAEDAFKATFHEIESRFEAMPEASFKEARGMRYPGCTALVALILKNKLFIANAGDCRAVLCRDGFAFQLSRDHTAMDVLERTRIQKTGASVHWRKGSWRIGYAGLQVTRSLGDIDLKPSGVSANPEITSFTLTASDSFLIIASDGLWDAVTNEEAVRFVHDTVKHPDMCAKRLVAEALTRGSKDNITVIVAFLRPVQTLEQIYVGGKHKYTRHAATRRFKLPRIAADEISETL